MAGDDRYNGISFTVQLHRLIVNKIVLTMTCEQEYLNVLSIFRQFIVLVAFTST